MKITFYGAAKEVTGSCYLVETKTKRFLIDCGLVQGSKIAEERNLEPFLFDPQSLDAVFITHAHLDHCGRLPKLVAAGFCGKIYATPPTLQFMELILDDSVDILAEEARRHGHDPIYTRQDLAKTLPLLQELAYHQALYLTDEVSVEFFDAGHILGSAQIKVSAEGKKIVFSGDLGNPPVPILKKPENIGSADLVIMESTYGGRLHEDKQERTLLLKSAIYETITMKGVLMIPAFAMERTQELLYELNSLVENKNIPSVPIFLDSPLAISATKIFKKFETYYNQDARKIIAKGDDVFNFPSLHFTLTKEESKKINLESAPKVIIAGSGMAQGGRILHHIEQYISHFNNQYLIVGYQTQGSLGRRILNGEKSIRVHGKPLAVKAKVRAIGGYSAHADQNGLLQYIRGFDRQQLKQIVLVHGEEEQQKLLATKLQENFQIPVKIPDFGRSIIF